MPWMQEKLLSSSSSHQYSQGTGFAKQMKMALMLGVHPHSQKVGFSTLIKIIEWVVSFNLLKRNIYIYIIRVSNAAHLESQFSLAMVHYSLESWVSTCSYVPIFIIKSGQ